MKVLINHGLPFFLAHGGVQVLIEQTKGALEQQGVEVEYVRWWDDRQKGDLIHYYGRMDTGHIQFAHQKNIPVVISELLTGQGSRPAWARHLYRYGSAVAEKVIPETFTGSLASRVYRMADAIRVVTSWEAHLMEKMYRVPKEKIHVVPDGVENLFLKTTVRERGKWLICTATITPRKRVLELANAAVEAQVPLWVIGKPYSENDSYYRRFLQVVEQNPAWIRYEGPVGNREQIAQIYREARGFVLLSTMESLSLSALEAAACECPLLLSDLPWARTTFGHSAEYCPIASPSKMASYLQRFYDAAPGATPSLKPWTWSEVANQLKKIYEELLSTSR